MRSEKWKAKKKNNEARRKKNSKMKKRNIPFILLLINVLWHAVLFAQDLERFPRPEFETDYVYLRSSCPAACPGMGIH